MKHLEEHLPCPETKCPGSVLLGCFSLAGTDCGGNAESEFRHINLCTWLKIISLLIACIMYDLIFICVW